MRKKARSKFHIRRLLFVAAGTALLTIGLAGFAEAWTLTTLHAFCRQAGCPDGQNPHGTMVMDQSGNLFGSVRGGENNGGAIFQVTKSGEGRSYRLLRKFCAGNCRNHAAAPGSLIMDVNGNLYGATTAGNGTVFELMADETKTKWRVVVLHEFCSGCEDGWEPASGLAYQGQASGALYDGISPLFGTTNLGGANNAGTVFEIRPRANKGKWKEDVIYSFCAQSGCADGAQPTAPVIVDGAGNLFGTTSAGGGGGVAFELTRAKRHWNEQVLHEFCGSPACGGLSPVAPLIVDASGNLFGTATAGGSNGWGTVFKLVPNGADSELTVLYNFCSEANCADGGDPRTALLLDEEGTLFGTAETGGAADQGVAYALSGSGYEVIHDFCSAPHCKDGSAPSDSLLTDGTGNLFGTAPFGGAHNEGTLFELSP